MSIEELERHVAELRSRPLLLVCQDQKGRQRTMTLEALPRHFGGILNFE